MQQCLNTTTKLLESIMQFHDVYFGCSLKISIFKNDNFSHVGNEYKNLQIHILVNIGKQHQFNRLNRATENDCFRIMNENENR